MSVFLYAHKHSPITKPIVTPETNPPNSKQTSLMVTPKVTLATTKPESIQTSPMVTPAIAQQQR